MKIVPLNFTAIGMKSESSQFDSITVSCFDEVGSFLLTEKHLGAMQVSIVILTQFLFIDASNLIAREHTGLKHHWLE